MTPNHWNYEQQAREAFDRHHDAIIKANMEAGNKLDEEQIFRVFCQALAAGDFVRLVFQGTGNQNTIYIPFHGMDELRSKYEELIMAVASKYEGESRHETALRYIQERESRQNVGNCVGIATK